MTSGLKVPEMASSWLVFPVLRFLSSYFVLIRDVRRMSFVQRAALHGRTTESSAWVTVREGAEATRVRTPRLRAPRVQASKGCAARAAHSSDHQVFAAAAGLAGEAYFLRNLSTR